MKVWAQKWTSSHSWDGREDAGYTLNLDRAALVADTDARVMAARSAEESRGYGVGKPPPHYTYADGAPREMDATDELAARVTTEGVLRVWNRNGLK